VRKRDGTVVPFDTARIASCVLRASREAGRDEPSVAAQVAQRVAQDLARRFRDRIPGVEDVQDAVERELAASGRAEIARHYRISRRWRAELREAKRRLAVRDELKLTLNAVAVLRERYLLRDEEGNPTESTAEMMERVATHVARAEEGFEPGSSGRWAAEFARALKALEFLPNSPTLMNAGTAIGQLSGCFVLPVEDSLDSIFDAVKQMALIHQAGGGTGFAFSRLRPRGDRVRSTGGTASGPLSFMRVFDVTTDVVKQGGRRRGANMATLSVSHPEISDSIAAKASPGRFENFNLSVAVTDRFMEDVRRDEDHPLVNPRSGRVVARVRARALFDQLTRSAWSCGDPGLLFIDRINRGHSLRALGEIETTNPCGEVPLLPYESCNLGSVNLARMLAAGAPDWERIRRTVRLAVRFLDDVIEVNRYPTAEVERATRRSRKVGLGVMGLAEFLALQGIAYDSEQALALAERVAETIAEEARRASAELARVRGPFPAWEVSDLAAAGGPPLRNAQLTSIAPTGTISIIAGTTAGIEPMFAISYQRNVLDQRLTEANPAFERLARDRGFYSEELIAEIARTGGLRGNPAVPEDVRRAFVTALELSPEAHLQMQAAFQRHTDAAVAKTVNLPASATVEEVGAIYLRAWELGVKGITVYRYGSKPGQVLTFLAESDSGPAPPVRVETDYAGGCAGYACEF
jgi:ribonucleoside-diphosphate reductase alpha chain